MIGASSKSAQLRYRSQGYADALAGRPSKALLFHPGDRFAYRAGYADGERLKEEPAQ